MLMGVCCTDECLECFSHTHFDLFLHVVMGEAADTYPSMLWVAYGCLKTFVQTDTNTCLVFPPFSSSPPTLRTNGTKSTSSKNMGLVKAVCILCLPFPSIRLTSRFDIPAPGFQTNVKQLRVTPEIAERLRRGEYVSAEEIAAAVARAEEEAKKRPPQGVIEVGFGPRDTSTTTKEEPVNEWLPENITNPKKRGKAKRR